MNREISVASWFRIIVLLLAIASGLLTAWALADPKKLYAAVGLISLLIVCSPFLVLKNYDLLSPWSFVVLPILVLATPQAICMSFDWPTPESVNHSMLLSKEPAYFYYPSMIYLSALVCLVVGYFGFQKIPTKPFTIRRNYHPVNLTLVMVFALAVSSVSTLAFIRYTGGGESTRVSDKRTTIRTVDVKEDKELRQYGYLRQFGKLSTISFLILYAYFLRRDQRLGMIQTAIVGSAFLLSCVLPFYSSSRSQLIWAVLSGLGVTYYLDQKSFRFKLMLAGAAALTVFLAMSFLRHSDFNEAIENASVVKSVESLILNRNGPGLSKTAHVINNVPQPLEFKYGKTFAVWLIAPIPRGLYPGKPLIHTGPIIGSTIYATSVSGVPPGFIAELYWNFHIPGVVFGMLFLGFGLYRVYAIFRNCQIDPAIIVPIYMFCVVQVGFAVLGNSLGFGVVMRLVDFVTIAIVIYFCTSSQRWAPPHPEVRA